jgi:thiamine transport system permease protein
VDRPDVRLSPVASRRVERVVLSAVPAVFLGLFFVFPLVSIVGSVITDVQPGSVLGDERLRAVIWFTTWQAVVSTVLTVAAGLPAAYLLARFRFPGRGLLRVATLVAFVLPTVVVGAAFAGSRPSLASLFAAHVFFNLAVVVRVVGSFWSQLDPAYEDVAAEMGAIGLRRFNDVLLPLARPSIVGAATLVFLFTFTSFGVALLLAGPARATIEVEIFRQTSQLLNIPVAAALTLVQLAIVSALLWLTSRIDAGAGERQRLVGSADAAREPRTTGERVFVALAAPLLAATVLTLPL